MSETGLSLTPSKACVDHHSRTLQPRTRDSVMENGEYPARVGLSSEPHWTGYVTRPFVCRLVSAHLFVDWL